MIRHKEEVGLGVSKYKCLQPKSVMQMTMLIQ